MPGPSESPFISPNILREAEAAVYGPRQAAYGHPGDNMTKTAILWRAYLLAKYGADLPLDGADVSTMQRNVKDARLMESPDHRDSLVDIAGYAAVQARWVGLDP